MEFILRDWKSNDKESLAQQANNKKIAENLRDVFPYPYTLNDAENYITMCINNGDTKAYTKAIVIDGKAVGSIGVFVKDDVYCKSGELGYWLGEFYWGKGIMTEAIKQICEEAFLKYELVRIYAEPFIYNMGSKRVLDKAGFTLEGILKKSIYKNGIISDSCIYGLVR